MRSTDLTNCDKEKIHLVGAVQSHGSLVAFRLSDKTIYHASANVDSFLKFAAQDMVGKRIDSVFGSHASLILQRAKDLEEFPSQYAVLSELNGHSGPFDLYLYQNEGLIVVEMEKRDQVAPGMATSQTEPHRRSRVFAENLVSSDALIETATKACKTIRQMIGFERVMMYRYLPNWDGEVIAEDKTAEAHSFYHHRFPATDIPLPARELYLKNRSRLIVNSNDQSVPILPVEHYLTRKPFDLSHSKLRAVSPIHLEYLRNMKVVSSFSVAVIVEGHLWGLIACHSPQQIVLSHEVRLACETVASTFAVLASMKEENASQSAKLKFEEELKALFRKLIKSRSLISALFKDHGSLQDMFSATGIALISGSRVEIAGLTPPESIVKQIAEWFDQRFQRENKSVLAVDSFVKSEETFGVFKEIACGAIALASADSIFILFRPEIIQTITWGGDVRKTMEKRNYQGIINPRNSFESWSETLSGRSKPWEPHEVRGAEFLRDFLFNDLIKKEKLLEELTHKFNT